MAVQISYEQLQHFVVLMVLLSFLCGAVGVVVMRVFVSLVALLGQPLVRSQRIRMARERAAARSAQGLACAGASSPNTAPAQPIAGSA